MKAGGAGRGKRGGNLWYLKMNKKFLNKKVSIIHQVCNTQKGQGCTDQVLSNKLLIMMMQSGYDEKCKLQQTKVV